LEYLRGDDPLPHDPSEPISNDPFAGKAQRAYLVVKYDGDGNRRWLSRFFEEGDNTNRVEGIVVDHRGDVYLTGTSIGRRNYAMNSEIATVKI
jgi:hypothetical protein